MDANSQLTLRNKAIPLVNNVLVERDVKDKSTMVCIDFLIKQISNEMITL